MKKKKTKKNNTFPDAHTHEKISTWMTYCHFFKKKTTKSNFHISHFWGSSLLPCLSCWDRIQLAFFYTFVTFYVFYRIFSWAKIPSCIRNLLSLVFWFHFICFVCWRRSEIFWQSGGKHPLTFSQEKKKKTEGRSFTCVGDTSNENKRRRNLKTHINTHVPLMRVQLNLSQTFIFHGNQLTEINMWFVETHVATLWQTVKITVRVI